MLEPRRKRVKVIAPDGGGQGGGEEQTVVAEEEVTRIAAKYLGVWRKAGETSWRASLFKGENGQKRTLHLGTFASASSAAQAYDRYPQICFDMCVQMVVDERQERLCVCARMNDTDVCSVQGRLSSARACGKDQFSRVGGTGGGRQIAGRARPAAHCELSRHGLDVWSSGSVPTASGGFATRVCRLFSRC